MQERIVFQVLGEPLAVLTPQSCGLSMREIGEKDVPAGVPFWIVSVNDLPADRALRNAWELDVNEAGPADGMGAAQ